MIILQAIQHGFSQLLQYKRIVGLIYVLVLVLAIFIALPLQSYLTSKMGHSLMVEDLVKGFDYTVFTDFMNAYGDGVSPILNQSVLIVVLFLVLMIFLTGGLVSTLLSYPRRYQKALFWGKSATYFGRFFRLSFYFILIHGLTFFFFFWIYLKLTKGFNIAELETDEIVFDALFYVPLGYTIVSPLFFMWHDYAKIFIVQLNQPLLFQPIIGAFQFITRHFSKTYSTYFLNVLLLGFVFLLNHWMTQTFSVSTSSTIWITFFISQIFVLARLGLKLINLGSAVYLIKNLK